MGDLFIRRTTGFLLATIFVLSIALVSLIVIIYDKKNSVSRLEISELIEGNRSHGYTQDIASTDKKSHGTKTATTSMTDKDIISKPKNTWEKNIRIPESTIPYHYDLFIHPNLKSKNFEGKVSILIGVTSTMNYLLTHVKFMNVTATSLSDSLGTTYELKDAFEYKPNEFWVVQPVQSLTPGNYTLSIDFNGSLDGHIVGFYMSEYKTAAGEKRSIATTKFQPTDARRAFPCFDEPGFKSTFKITIIRPTEKYIALSNMPIEREIARNPSEDLTKVEFQTSVPMVTYLVCFIVCDFDYLETMTDDNKPFRVYSTKDQIERSKYALDLGVDVLNYFERYFEVEYPLPKQDMIAIPDFVSGAMEHWGLITYRETNLLYDDANSSSYNKQRVASVISHELAHMWFGNLVTLKWWDDLWLNEGFASYIEYKGVANYEKDWAIMEQFLISDLHSVFELDQILSSHPIVQPVHHPDEITEIFDTISYSKGASVLRMLEDFMGPENFRIGIRNFLRKHKYGSAVTQDLWNELQMLSKDINITRIMDTWTRQMGFPVLKVSISSHDKTELDVKQERFLINPEAKIKDDSLFHYKWDIPVTFKTMSKNRSQIWFNMEQQSITLKLNDINEWIKINVDQYGYYRINYDQELWKRLINLLKNNHMLLSPSDRANLIDDSFSLASANKLPYEIPFDLITYLPKETHYVPWSAVTNHLNKIGKLLRNTKAYKSFRKYSVNIIDQHVKRVGWEDTGTHIERRNRGNILSLACSNGHRICMDNARQIFEKWISSHNYSIPANLRTIIYTNGIKETGEKEWDIIFDRYITELNAQEKSKLLRSLTSTKDSWICNRFLELGRNHSIVRKQDFFTMVNYFAYNPSTIYETWNFLRKNYDWMVAEFGLNNRYLGRTVLSVASEFTSAIQLKELKLFFDEHPDAGAGKRARLQALEKLNENIKWIERYSLKINLLLENLVNVEAKVAV